VGASIGWSLGAAAGGFLFPESGPNVEGARLDDLRVMGSSYGVPIPIVYGAMRVPGNVVWAANLREIRTEEDLGGKGGPSATQVSYSYTGTFAVAVCEGPVAAITRVWANGQCVYDVRNPANTEALVASGNWVAVSGMRVYLGTESQLPDPAIEAAQGVGTTPAFRGLCYVVFENMPLEQFGNALPRQLDFEVVTGVGADYPQRVLLTPATLGRTYAAPWIARLAPGVVAITDGTASLAELRSPWDGSAAGSEITTAPPALPDVGLVRFAGYGPDARPVYTRAGVIGATDGAPLGLLAVGAADSANLLAPLLPGRELFACALGDQEPTAVVLHGAIGALWPDQWLAIDLESGAPVDAGSIDAALTATVAFGVARTGTAAVDPYARALERGNWRRQWAVARTNNYSVDAQVIGADNVLRLEARFIYAGNEANQPLWGIKEALTPGTLAIAAADGIVAIAAADLLWVYRRITGSAITAPTLPSVVAGICARAGLTAGQIDTTLLTGTVDGVAYTRGGSGRSMLDSLRAAYWFDAVESGDKIRFVPRGGAPVAALTLDDLVADDAGAAVSTEREHSDALPARVAVAYAAAASDYRVGSQLAVRGSLTGDALRTLELPLALSDARAAQAAQVALADAWMGRTARTLAVMPKWAALEPTDVIDLADATRSARLRVVRKAEALGAGIRLEVVDEEAALYSPSATAGTVAATGNSPALAGPTRLEVLDLPPLRDADDNAGYYAALAGYTSAWRGGVLFDSPDGASFTEVAASGRGAVIGAAETALSDFAGGNVFDEASTVDVAVGPAVTLASITRAQALGGANAAVLGSEVIVFRVATLLSAGRYRLSGLLRGRVGTEWAMAGHAAGERFVLLTTALVDVPAGVADVGSARTLKAASVGEPLANAAPRAMTLAGARLKPFAPAHLAAAVTAEGVALRWRRSNRLGYAWRDFGDAPLSETAELYDLELLGAGDVVVKSWADLAVTEQAVSWLELRTALGQIPASLTARAYQRSGSVGRGWPARRVLPLSVASTVRNWDDQSLASQTLFGTGTPQQQIASLGGGNYCLQLLSAAATDAKVRFDFAPSAANFWLFCRVRLGGSCDLGVVYRTTSWVNANDTFAYFAGINLTSVYLGRGSNSGAGSYTPVTSTARTQVAGTWYELAIAVQGSRHRAWIDGTLAFDVTDATHAAPGQFGARVYASVGNCYVDDLTIIT